MTGILAMLRRIRHAAAPQSDIRASRQLAELLGSGPRPEPIDLSVLRAFAGDVPEEYRWFIERFGPGVVNEVLTVFAPIPDQPAVDLISRHEEFARELRQARTAGVTNEKALPETDGLLLWATASDGSSYYWRASGKSAETWTVVCGNGELDFTDISLTTSELLVAVASQKPGFDHASHEDAVVFEPWERQEEAELPEYPVIRRVAIDGRGAGEVEIEPGATRQATQARVDTFIERLEREFPDLAAAVTQYDIGRDPVLIGINVPAGMRRAFDAIGDWEIEA